MKNTSWFTIDPHHETFFSKAIGIINVFRDNTDIRLDLNISDRPDIAQAIHEHHDQSGPGDGETVWTVVEEVQSVVLQIRLKTHAQGDISFYLIFDLHDRNQQRLVLEIAYYGAVGLCSTAVTSNSFMEAPSIRIDVTSQLPHSDWVANPTPLGPALPRNDRRAFLQAQKRQAGLEIASDTTIHVRQYPEDDGDHAIAAATPLTCVGVSGDYIMASLQVDGTTSATKTWMALPTGSVSASWTMMPTATRLMARLTILYPLLHGEEHGEHIMFDLTTATNENAPISGVLKAILDQRIVVNVADAKPGEIVDGVRLTPQPVHYFADYVAYALTLGALPQDFHLLPKLLGDHAIRAISTYLKDKTEITLSA